MASAHPSDHHKEMKPVNVVAPQQSHPQPATDLMMGDADFSLRELRQCEKLAEKQLLQLREKRAEMEKIVEQKRQKAIEEEELRRKREAEQCELAIEKLSKEKAELSKRREEMEKDFLQREAEAAAKLQQLQKEAEELKVAEWIPVTVDEKTIDDDELLAADEKQSTGYSWMGSWLMAPKKWIGNWWTPEKREEMEDPIGGGRCAPVSEASVSSEQCFQPCYEDKETRDCRKNIPTDLRQPEQVSLSFQQELQQRIKKREEVANIQERKECEKDQATRIDHHTILHDEDDDLPSPPVHVLEAASKPMTTSASSIPPPPPPPPVDPIPPSFARAVRTSNDARSNLFSEIRSGHIKLRSTASVAPVQSAPPLVTRLPPIQPISRPVVHLRPRPPVPPKPSKLRQQSAAPGVISPPSKSNETTNNQLPDVRSVENTQVDSLGSASIAPTVSIAPEAPQDPKTCECC